jgi:hypothetical protein
MLDHRHPAIAGLRSVLVRAIGDVLKRHLLEFLFIRIDRRPGKGARPHAHHAAAVTFRRLAITCDLVIGTRGNLGTRPVDDVMRNIHQIGTPVEGIGLGHPHAIGRRRLKLHHQRVLAFFQCVITRNDLPERLVVGQTFSDQTTLGKVDMLFATIEQHKMLVGLIGRLVAIQLQTHQITPLGRNLGPEEVSDHYLSRCHRRHGRPWNHGRRHGITGRRRRRRYCGSVGRRLGRHGINRGPVMFLPTIPQHDHREAKHHQKNKSLIIHLKNRS